MLSATAAIAAIARAPSEPNVRSSVRRRVERQRAPRVERTQVQRAERAPRVERQRVQRAERAPRVERQRVQRAERAPRIERAQRVERQQRIAQRAERAPRVERQQRRTSASSASTVSSALTQRAPRVERQARIDRQQVRAAERQQVRANQVDRAQLRADRQALQINRQQARDERRADRQILRDDARWSRFDNRLASRDALRTTRFAALDNRITTQFVEPVRVRTFLGAPIRTVSAFTPLLAMPSTISYLYPDTDDYYYRYGGGYAYRVDRGNDLISWILPLLAGGFMPGQYLPASYMNSYVPNYYGFNSFYPDSPYDCNRYVNGVIYEIGLHDRSGRGRHPALRQRLWRRSDAARAPTAITTCRRQYRSALLRHRRL